MDGMDRFSVPTQGQEGLAPPAPRPHCAQILLDHKFRVPCPRRHTHGSGECMGEEAWRMYCVH